MADANWAKFAITTTLIGGGVTLLWLGVRPWSMRSEREKREDIRESWLPPEVNLTPSQKSQLEIVGQKLNQVRAAIRQRWAQTPPPTATNLPPNQKSSPKIFQEILQNEEYPWKHQELAWYRRDVQTDGADYETDQVSPYLQNAVMMVDLLLLEATNINLPAQIPIAEFSRQLDRILQNPSILEVVSAHAARERGQWLKAKINHNYEVERAKEFERTLKQNVEVDPFAPQFIQNWDREIWAWIAFGTFLSPLSSEERKALRALRNTPTRQPRTLTL